MSEVLRIYDPSHPNSNIHGIVGDAEEPVCSLDETTGVNCTACCTLLGIEAPHPLERNKAAKWYKPFGVPCEFLEKDPNKPGCSIYINRPRNCVNYHCSKSPVDLKARLLTQAVIDGSTSIEKGQTLVAMLQSDEANRIWKEFIDTYQM